MKRILKIFYILAVLFPIAFLIGLSISSDWQYPSILPQVFNLANWYDSIFGKGNIFQSLLLSLVLSFSIAALVTFLAFFISKYIANSPNRTLYINITLIPYVLSPIILAVIFQYFFTFFDLSGHFFGVLLAQLFFALPFGIIIFNNFWNKNLQDLEQLSFTLGANRIESLTKVILPLSKPAIILCFFQSFLVSWFEYGLTQFIGLGKVKTLTVLVFNFINEANIFYAALACVLLILPPILLLYFNKKILILKR